MFDKKKIRKLKSKRYNFYKRSYSFKNRRSLIFLTAYLFDKEFILNKDFTLQRIADRAGILSLTLSDSFLREILFQRALELNACKIEIINFRFGNQFLDRLIIFIIFIIQPKLVVLKISFFNFEEYL